MNRTSVRLARPFPVTVRRMTGIDRVWATGVVFNEYRSAFYVLAYDLETPDADAGDVWLHNEGTTWVRGWGGPSVAAFKTVVTLRVVS